MSRLISFLALALLSSVATAQTVFINEIHYDNTGADAGEFVEVAGPPGTNLTGWTIVPYNGSGGASYAPIGSLAGTLPTSCTGLGVMSVAIVGLQNGAPDGLALVNAANVVVQFLSYEGAFTATNGPANGMLSVDIGVLEAGSEPVGQSLRLSGTGNTYPAFTWNAPAAATPGACNTGQTGVAPPTIYGITGDPAGLNLISFSSATPGTVVPIGALSGIVAGHSVRAIDFRPANSQLYALSTNGTAYQLYTVNLATAALTPVGAVGNVATAFPNFVSIDFNPAADRLRVVTTANRSYRINPNDGVLVLEDTALAYVAGDPNFGNSPTTVGVAYDRNDNNAGTPTTLFAYDYSGDVLTRIGSVDGTPTSPNSGQLNTIGSSGVTTDDFGVGMDIGATGTAYLSYSFIIPGAEKSRSTGKTENPSGVLGPQQFGTMNLATGAVTLVGNIAAGVDLLDIAVQLPAAAAADLSIVMTDSPDPVAAGSNITYLVTMTNTGPDAAQNARFTVPLPPGTSLVSAAPSATGSCPAANPVVCTWAGATANAGVRTATIVVSVPANTADGAFLNSSATALSDTNDPDPADNLSTVSTSVVTVADVSVTLGDSPDPVSAGGVLTYVVTVSNLGPSNAQNVDFNLPLPTGTTFASVTASAGFSCNAASPVICSWAGATVPGAGGNRTATITANVAPNLANGAQLIATVSASSDTTDLVAGNNEAEATTTVQTSADLAITLVDSPDPVIAGNQLTWVATLTNLGPSDAQGANISLPLPLGTSFASASASTGGNCTIGNPVVCTWTGPTTTADTRIATIVANVASSQTAGLSATATAASLTNDPTPGNSTATADTVVEVQSDLTISLTDTPDPVTAGTNLTYTATVANIGPSDATGVSTSMAVPGNTSFVSGTVSGGGSCGGTPVACVVSGSILPGSSRTITIVVLVAPSAPDGSVISADITVASYSPDLILGNNSANTTTTVSTSADLALSLTASVPTALVNEPVTFTATSLNQGPSDAQNVSITVTLTPDFRYTSHVATGATCTVPQVGTTGAIVCTWAGATAPGMTRTLTVVAASNVEGPTGVNASTTSITFDPDTANNSDNVVVQVGYLVEEIPTLSGYGLILLGLMFGLFGLAAVRRQA